MNNPAWIRWTRRTAVVLGVVMLTYAVIGGSFIDRFALVPYLRFVLIALVLGAVMILLTLLVARLIARFVPAGIRPFVQASLFISAGLVAVAIPVLLGFGRRADLPSALPRDYSTGLFAALAVVWLGITSVFVVRVIRQKRKEAST